MGLRVYSKCRWAEDFGLKISLVERLHTHYEQYNNTSSNLKSSSVKDKPPYVVLLFENYRCHAKILEFPSDCFYGGELIAKGDQSTHDLVPVLSFYTAQGVDQQVEGSLAYYNDAEVAEVVKRVEELVHLWPKDWSKSIGVVTPYRDQVERIRHGLRKKGLGDVHVGTVEGVQGKEFKALFISTVRTMQTCSWIEGRNSDPSELDFGFLSDPRFLNAAVTRAQSLLAVVGDPMSLCSVGQCRNLWKDYLHRCDANKGLYGCTLKTVMDFCLCFQALDPSAHEFIPGKNVPDDETLISASSEVVDNDENKDEDDSETSRSATDNFFRRNSIEDFDKIIEVLVKACREAKEKEDGGRRSSIEEDFLPLNDVSPTTSAVCNEIFSAGLKDGRIEMGFHVKDSERLFRLTGGISSFKENKDLQSCDIELLPEEELLKLLEENPARFIKCTFRIDTSGRQRRYYGQLPTPDSPDIRILGSVRGVYEDDIVVLELEDQEEEIGGLGYEKGVLRRLVEPEERRFVCTVDRNPHVMIPINKSSWKLANFTKTDEKNIIPIYTMKYGNVTRATILSKKHYAEALAGERVFVVKYLKWRPDCPYPLGLAIRYIPHGRDFTTGMEILYAEHNVQREFNKKLRKSVKREFSENWQVPASEKGRPVYRDNVFTIDPPESLDLDDAISIRSLGNGNYELHIHIADVSYFIQPNTALDEEARLRGTSYYPPDETVPMLPRVLSEDICSLLEGKDRLTLTLSVEVKSDGTVVGDARIERGVVCSSCRLTYLQAQKFIDETDQTEVFIKGERREIPVEEAIRVIHRIAQGRRRSRLGVARSLYQRKDWDDNLDNVREAHQMIEEIMIMANHLVAKYLLRKFPNCTPLFVQPPPKTRRVVDWRNRFQKFVNLSLGLEWLGDKEIAQEEKIGLKVPFKTWNMIMSKVDQDSNFQELVKIVCDLDLFPQLSLANVHQQQLQQRGRYICSGETFENIPFPWPQVAKEAPEDKQKVQEDKHADNKKVAEDSTDYETIGGNVKTDAPDEQLISSSAFVNRGEQSSSNVPNDGNLKNILYGHFSLCLDTYCHFTSPIRRYIDIIVHRLVVASIEDKPNFMDSDDITTLCDRCTYIARNFGRFDKDTKKLQLAVNSQSSLRFVSAFVDEVTPDALKLFFGTGELELLPGKSVRIARLGPDKDPEEVDDHIKLQWTFRFLRLDRQGRAQPKLHIPDDEESLYLAKKLERQNEDEEEPSNLSDNDFDYTVSGENWNEVLEAVKDEKENKLKSRLQEVDVVVREQRKPKSSTKVFVLKRIQNDPCLSSSPPYQPPIGKSGPFETETDEVLRVTKSFKSYDRVKVQICSQMTRGVLSPAIQLFKLTDKIHACIEHRSFPTTCFAKITHNRPTNAKFLDITEYVKLWKPVLMMEIVTSAVRDNDVIILSNLFVSLERDSEGIVTLEFKLSYDYCKDHFLDPLDLNLMCVRVKNSDGSGKDTGYWVGHFQISEELKWKEEDEEAEKNASSQKDQDVSPIEAGLGLDLDEYRSVLARLIHSSAPIPESLITQKFCYVSVELIRLSIPDRRRFKALVHSDKAPKLIRDICTGKVSTELDVVDDSSLPQTLSLCDVYPTLQKKFYPLNYYQVDAVKTALTKSFTLIQGPPGTGKTVTGVHIAYWFAQLNKSKTASVKKDGYNGSMVFYCGPSNKSVDVVAHFLMKIPGLKILRIYGQEIERKEFPVPDLITEIRSLFPSKRVSVQLKADKDLKDVSLHHVIRSVDCPFAKDLEECDKEFRRYIKDNRNAPRVLIDKFSKLKSKAENWAITQRRVNVILVTCTTAYGRRVSKPCEGFVCQCIIDECGMCIEAETLCAMMGSKAKQIVLIGDHEQLQPVIQCNKAKDLGLRVSMFERFSKRAKMLEIQYRMHKELCRFPSEFFYDGKLETAKNVLDRKPDNVKWPNGNSFPFVFHHVEGIEESLVVTTGQGNENSKKNQKEIAKVVHITRTLTNEGIEGKDIVILSPYRAQCFEITEKLKQHGFSDISAMSVVAAQGSEKNYVILSLVRSLPEKEIEKNPLQPWLRENLGFLTDKHQINVALTRAKRGLFIIGNANLIGVCSMWKKLLDHYEKRGCLMMGPK